MDYANGRRLKLWGRAKVVDDPELIAQINSSETAVVERAIIFTVLAWDWNCSQHIPRLVSADAFAVSQSGRRYSINQVSSGPDRCPFRVDAVEKGFGSIVGRSMRLFGRCLSTPAAIEGTLLPTPTLLRRKPVAVAARGLGRPAF